jgi:hypothetical protein
MKVLSGIALLAIVGAAAAQEAVEEVSHVRHRPSTLLSQTYLVLALNL